MVRSSNHIDEQQEIRARTAIPAMPLVGRRSWRRAAGGGELGRAAGGGVGARRGRRSWGARRARRAPATGADPGRRCPGGGRPARAVAAAPQLGSTAAAPQLGSTAAPPRQGFSRLAMGFVVRVTCGVHGGLDGQVHARATLGTAATGGETSRNSNHIDEQQEIRARTAVPAMAFVGRRSWGRAGPGGAEGRWRAFGPVFDRWRSCPRCSMLWASISPSGRSLDSVTRKPRPPSTHIRPAPIASRPADAKRGP
jgi:hypothetical protein